MSPKDKEPEDDSKCDPPAETDSGNDQGDPPPDPK